MQFKLWYQHNPISVFLNALETQRMSFWHCPCSCTMHVLLTFQCTVSPLIYCCLGIDKAAKVCKACPEHHVCVCTGVRYPAHLLPLVVATLTSMQALMPAQNQARDPLAAAELSGGTALQAEALKAAAMGAGGALRNEAVSPIDKKSLTKAFRCCCQLTCFALKGFFLLTRM